MTEEELYKLIEKAEFSGWPRDEAAKLVIKLCKALILEKTKADTFQDTIARMERLMDVPGIH